MIELFIMLGAYLIAWRIDKAAESICYAIKQGRK